LLLFVKLSEDVILQLRPMNIFIYQEWYEKLKKKNNLNIKQEVKVI